ncbi:hypothetical protein ACMA1D_20245 [Streptomyces sp. 796.1]|uniref:hypothetical protein n=1 Tax=Streptomyces sp. 796.1 TaxID=3163029 RepID=UPI0039C9EFE6
MTTIRIPRQRGRRSQPVVVVVPDRPSWTREALGFAGRMLWRFRRALAPAAAALFALGVTALLHAVAWWSGLALAVVAIVPLVWLVRTQHTHPATGTALGWRIALTLVAVTTLVWLALAAGFGPLSAPLLLAWLVLAIGAQAAWLFVRRSK